MKKYLAFFVMAALAVVSCNKEKGAEVIIPEDVITRGIEHDMQNGAVSFDVKSEGKWYAVIDADADWVSLSGQSIVHNGSEKLILYFDENLTKADRKTTLQITNTKGDMKEIQVCQYYNYEGQAPENDALAFMKVGVGYGADYDYVLDTKSIKQRCALEDAKVKNDPSFGDNDRTHFEPTKVRRNNNIFNVERIEELQKEDALQSSAYVEAVIPLADLQASLFDSVLVQYKEVKLSLKLGVSFGPIEFEASATYNGKKDESKAHVDYVISRNAPMYNVTISEAEISTYAENFALTEVPSRQEIQALMDEINELKESYYLMNGKRELKKSQQRNIDNLMAALSQPTYDNVFSTAFAKNYWDLYTAVIDEEYETADRVLNKLDNLYGPFYISGGNFGGALTVHARVDTLRMQGYADFNGSLKADVSGMFSVTGAFEYSENGFNVMHDSDTKIYIYGGNANVTTNTLLSIITGGNPDDMGKWQEALKGWVDSMYTSGSNNPNLSEAAPLSYVLTPIWTLFADDEVQDYAQNYFLEKYKDRGIYEYFGLMRGDKEVLDVDEHFNNN